ncbi:PREDICTED: uncharacterized protein LOC104613015 [Nelumbo nucifera]|uniref:Uncharacterized protein LOC104613015 n=1 Tax=Nelumbo nucifera TaxID=4432 RepID=A0A1U8QCH2_NELNU|nr:PREDICTED: uncharacterized protein LOC104613015 [Nelumbo nucifera]XP_019055956.1 PREDICTED: uncharacterized protein LOC104613015 [Nelumbo nucifera]XP_019055957.1 PREDICTED: uncharacterized protein LOC104613015 [Nelumbo nucifera]
MQKRLNLENRILSLTPISQSEETVADLKADQMVAKGNKYEMEDHSSDLEKDPKHGKEDESDSEMAKDSVSSQGDIQTTEDDKVERVSRVPKKLAKKESSESRPHSSTIRKNHQETSKSQNVSNNTSKRSTKSSQGSPKVNSKGLSDNKSNNMKVPPKPSSESSEGVDDKAIDEVKDINTLDEAPSGAHSIGSDDETAGTEKNGLEEQREIVNHKIEEMEQRIEKLEEELREIAALEISLYSVVPEHGSSAHKVHTPARRLSRLYIHACKHWTQDKRATIARNTASGLVLIAKSCGNDVSRLTFWLSNTIVLREIISQAFGNSHHSNPITRFVEANGAKISEGKPSSLKWKASPGPKQVKKPGFMQIVDDWQETSTFIMALEKVESWIFSRIVESVWWQTLTPHMQPPVEEMHTNKSFGKLLGPALGDQQQGSFSINLWKSAFQDAFQRVCPVRAEGHECGCLPVLARMVMEQCVARLDVAMFNAILRESAHEIPTDPVSDPIVDSKVLPIPAGDLSFGSGAQLKNSVGNWSRWLSDLFGMDADDSVKDQASDEDDFRRVGDAEPKSFYLLNALSDLLMLPKDMLMDRSIRKEVCPSIGLPLVKRILCNFTPDEFCPDPVPGAVLEALNAESIVEWRLSNGDSNSSFPYIASPVVYTPPTQADVAEKVADAGGKPQLGRNVSVVQRKGYTSDEELDELDSPLTCIIDKMPPSPTLANGKMGNGNGKHKETTGYGGGNVRYELLREVWST